MMHLYIARIRYESDLFSCALPSSLECRGSDQTQLGCTRGLGSAYTPLSPNHRRAGLRVVWGAW